MTKILKKNYSEWDVMQESLHDRQVDIVCLIEVNLDVAKPEVRHAFNEKAKRLDKSMNLIVTAASKTTIDRRTSKRGGIVTLIRGN